MVQFQLITGSDSLKMIEDDGTISVVPNDPANRHRAVFDKMVAEEAYEPLPADEE